MIQKSCAILSHYSRLHTSKKLKSLIYQKERMTRKATILTI